MVLQGARSGGGAQSALLDGSASLLVGAAPGGVQRVPFDAKLRALARVYGELCMPGRRSLSCGAEGGAQPRRPTIHGDHQPPAQHPTLSLSTLAAEVASEEGKVELPLCAECAAEVHKELEGQLAELQQVRRGQGCGAHCAARRTSVLPVAGRAACGRHVGAWCQAGCCDQRAACGPVAPLFAACLSACPSAPPLCCRQEVAAYEAALTRLEGEGLKPLDERTFQQQLAAAQAEVAGER